MKPLRRRMARRGVEGTLWLLSLGCAGYCTVMYGRAHEFARAVPAQVKAATRAPVAGELIARMEIRALGLSVPVVEDDVKESLQMGVGHIPMTAMPGGLGTVGLAGHRDTFLRPLRRVEPQMEVRLEGSGGTYRYIVDSTEIVMPEDVRVLDTVDQPSLVIVTCYPFDYVGAAPKRFVVHAHLLSVQPE